MTNSTYIVYKIKSPPRLGETHEVVREGDDAGRVSPFATRLLGMIAALTKDKYAAMELNNVNGRVNELIKKVLFTFALSLERSIALMTSVDC